jgi:hypothetical protein
LLAIWWTIFSILKSSPKFQKIVKNARASSRYAYRVVKKLSELLLNPRLYYHILNLHGFVLTQQNAHFIQKYEVVLVEVFHLIPIRNTSKLALVRSPD